MSLIIDGFNLIYKFPKFESHMANGNLTKAMNGLTQTLQDYCSITQKKLTIVYDGKKEMGNNIQHEKIGSINIYYSLDVIADDIIKKFIKEKVNPKMSTVVTSDKKLIFYLNRFQPTIIRSEEFAIEVLDTIESSLSESSDIQFSGEELSEDDVKLWEKIFQERNPK